MQGNNKEAFKYFGKAISQNPPYELEFNARIRQTECLTKQNKKAYCASSTEWHAAPRTRAICHKYTMP